MRRGGCVRFQRSAGDDAAEALDAAAGGAAEALEQSAGVEGEDAEGCGEVEENPFHGWEVGGWWLGVKRAGFSEEQACGEPAGGAVVDGLVEIGAFHAFPFDAGHEAEVRVVDEPGEAGVEGEVAVAAAVGEGGEVFVGGISGDAGVAGGEAEAFGLGGCGDLGADGKLPALWVEPPGGEEVDAAEGAAADVC